MAPDEAVTAECVHEVLVVGPGIRMSVLSLCNAMVRMLHWSLVSWSVTLISDHHLHQQHTCVWADV